MAKMTTIEFAKSESKAIEMLATVCGRTRDAKVVADRIGGAKVACNKQSVLVGSFDRGDARAARAALENLKARTFGPLRYTTVEGEPFYFFTVA